MKVTVCIGSSCHIKGSRQVVAELQRLMNIDETVLRAMVLRLECEAVACEEAPVEEAVEAPAAEADAE